MPRSWNNSAWNQRFYVVRHKFIDAALQEQLNAALQEQLGVEPAVLHGAP
jgi:hypothetical protein